MSIASQLKFCPKCGGPIPAEAPQGLCPKCLLLQASIPTETGKGAPSKSAPPTHEELVAAFPQLEILELIGQGGMGFVFKARQSKIERLVALKILPQSLAADPAFAERFTREGRVLARLNHPNIVTIHDFGQANGFFYLLMEFVDGVNLRQAMKAGRFTPAQALAIVPKICEALQFAHNEGILHRDIKPENILLDSKGRVKIADFGIAKLLGEPHTDATRTGSGATLGTPHYMAPEQLERPGEVDHRADIYSLGVVLADMRDHAHRLKRSGGQPHESIDPGTDTSPGLQLPDANNPSPDRVFDRRWALTLLERALTVLAEEHKAAGKSDQFEALKPWLTGDTENISQAEAARQLDLNEGEVKVAIHRLRRRFREVIKNEIGQTVNDRAQVDEELHYLLEAQL
jgi:serine/threonine protein kinase